MRLDKSSFLRTIWYSATMGKNSEKSLLRSMLGNPNRRKMSQYNIFFHSFNLPKNPKCRSFNWHSFWVLGLPYLNDNHFRSARRFCPIFVVTKHHLFFWKIRLRRKKVFQRQLSEIKHKIIGRIIFIPSYKLDIAKIVQRLPSEHTPKMNLVIVYQLICLYGT